jgi:hypothetical protein
MLKYDFEIIYQKGSEMPADFLSRNVVSQLRQKRINSLQFENQDFKLEQDKEPWPTKDQNLHSDSPYTAT